MAKYTPGEWADYVRGVLSEKKATLMSEHLAGSEARGDRKLVASLERLAAAARDEIESPPPDYAVHSVETFFRHHKPKSKSVLERLELDLAFDSALAPAAVGSRSLDDTSRQLLYQSGQYALDLRVGYPGDRHGSVVVGQLLQRAGEPMERVPAHLLAEGEIASTAFTSEYGSFCIESGATPPMQLRLLVDRNREIVVDLDPPAESVS